MRFDRAADAEHLVEVRACLVRAQLRRIRYVAAAPDHDAVATLSDVAPDQECIGEPTRRDTDVPVHLVGPPFRAHRAVLAADALAPVRRPLALHEARPPAFRANAVIRPRSGT